jgi:Ca-activated chloride channel family protein
MVFANKEYLFILLLLIPYIIWYILKKSKNEPTLQVSDTHMYASAPKSYKIYLLHAPFVLRVIALVMIALVLARPQTVDNWQNTEVEGIDIMLAVDVSTSMLAEDLKPNRLEAAKQVAAEFINGRPNDNIGLTIFAGQSFTQCPLTVDHAVLLNLFRGIKCDIAQRGLIEDGTAIGMGIANAVTRRYLSLDGCRDCQELRCACLHHRCGYQRNRALSHVGLRTCAVCQHPCGD